VFATLRTVKGLISPIYKELLPTNKERTHCDKELSKEIE
jgi:hypothetical protein